VHVGMLQALGEQDIAPDVVAGTSVRSLNGAVVAQEPKSATNRLSHLWARMTRDRVFPGGLLAQVRTLQHTETHLFPSTGVAAALLTDLMCADVTFADLALPFAAVTMDVAGARPYAMRDGPLGDAHPGRGGGRRGGETGRLRELFRSSTGVEVHLLG
jgi:NTE family protein